MAQFVDSFFSEDNSQIPVSGMWIKFKTEFCQQWRDFVASEITKTYNMPWIDFSVKD